MPANIPEGEGLKLAFFVLSFDQEALSVNQDNASRPWGGK
jgi:hypothetical protein